MNIPNSPPVGEREGARASRVAERAAEAARREAMRAEQAALREAMRAARAARAARAVRVADQHDGLVRLSHWVHVPLLLGLIASGIAIYWAAPVFHHAPQRGAYFTMPILGLLVVLSGWAMHHPATLGPLERMFVTFDGARIVHFVCMALLGSFLIPHVILVVADGWDTFRGMVTGWTLRTRTKGAPHA